MAVDNIVDSTVSIVKSNIDMAKNSLLSAWENRDDRNDFSETIAEKFSKIPEPFSSLRTNYLQTTFIK